MLQNSPQSYRKERSDAPARVKVQALTSMLFVRPLFCRLVSEQVVNELGVDRSRGEQMQINIDITMHRLGCSLLSIDVMDVSGDYHLHVDDHEILKQRIDWNGKKIKVDPHKSDVGPEVRPHAGNETVGEDGATNTTAKEEPLCLSCYGAEEKQGQCCNTCDDVREAYRRRGWALNSNTNVAQCKHDEYLESLE